MKRFLIITFSLLAFALVVSVITYIFVVAQIQNQSSTVKSAPASAETSVAASASVPAEGIPLRDIPLTDTQKSTLETVGVDVETFVITPAMQVCVAEKLGTVRMEEITAGDTPTFLETTKLLPCLGAE